VCGVCACLWRGLSSTLRAITMPVIWRVFVASVVACPAHRRAHPHAPRREEERHGLGEQRHELGLVRHVVQQLRLGRGVREGPGGRGRGAGADSLEESGSPWRRATAQRTAMVERELQVRRRVLQGGWGVGDGARGRPFAPKPCQVPFPTLEPLNARR